MTHPPVPLPRPVLPPGFAASMQTAFDASAVSPPPDFGARIAATFRNLRRILNRSVEDLTARVRLWHHLAVVAVNAPEHVAGLEARYHVRAALDPAYASDEALSALVVSVLQGEDPDLVLLTVENRALVAAAAVRGWAQTHPAPVRVLAWHRLIGASTVVVTRG